jgi:hypothetical protein
MLRQPNLYQLLPLKKHQQAKSTTTYKINPLVSFSQLFNCDRNDCLNDSSLQSFLSLCFVLFCSFSLQNLLSWPSKWKWGLISLRSTFNYTILLVTSESRNVCLLCYLVACIFFFIKRGF